MSSFVCGNKTISAIAHAMVDYMCDEITCAKVEGMPPIMIYGEETAKNVGQALLDENVKAVNERYDEDNHYDFELVDIIDLPALDPKTIWGCIRCYVYQACDDSEWENSKVKADIDKLKEKLIERVFTDAPYGID